MRCAACRHPMRPPPRQRTALPHRAVYSAIDESTELCVRITRSLDTLTARTSPCGGPRMIEVSGLTKTYGSKRAVHDLSFQVRPGVVTGFLGPNGAGKTTTMRLILGLDHPTAGVATIGGKPYRRLGAPLHTVGAMLDAKAVHPGRTARNHLLALAASNGIPLSRVDEVIEQVGLGSVARKRVGSFSLG